MRFVERVEAAVGAVVHRQASVPEEPLDEAWTEDDVYDRYPQLSTKFA